MAENKVQLTPAQQAVVEDRGGALLVSAAAGSGKTKVLVDRLLAQVCAAEQPANIDDFLIITYTKAAAAELRGKIAKELSARLAEEPLNLHLQKQLTRIYLAQISTVHAFCAGLLRDYAHTLDIPADFRVAEEQEATQLRQECMQTLLEQCYQELEGDENLRALIDLFGFGRDDRRLAELVMPVYGAVRCQVDPEAWMQRCEAAYQFTAELDASQTPWGSYLINRLHKTTAWVQRSLSQAISALVKDAVLEEKYLPVFQQNLALVTELAARTSWDEIYENRVLSFGKLPPVKNPENPELKETAQNARTDALQALKDAQACFYAPSAQIMEDLERTAKPICGLMQLLRRFDKIYAQEKRRRKWMDFSDLEHESIRLLCQKGTSLPTAAAREVAEKYREILVDEYQDSNAVQERIFEAVSRGGKNRFMVGDVKQSIYRFRLADPGIFLEKYQSYAMRGKEESGTPRKILLSENFRSRPEILRAVNDVFSLVMSPEAAELSYGEEEALRCGLPAFPPSPQPKVELHCIELDTKAVEGTQKTEKCEEEAAYVAARIHTLLTEQTMIADHGVLRRAEAKDIVILVHSPGRVAAQYMAALAKYRIACVSDRGGSILNSTQIETLCAMLQIVNNPHQDIPLTTVMASHVFGFSPEELAQARNHCRSGDLYECVCDAAKTSEKMMRFLQWLTAERDCAERMTLGAVIEEILLSTGLEEIFASMPDGTRRKEELQAFRTLATGFETTRGGLMQFVRYLEDLRQSDTPVALPENGVVGNAVRIMSIHKSKGLEFPIVVLADLSRKFNLQDNNASVLLDDQLLVGADVVRPESRLLHSSIARMAIADRKKRQSVAEEMRVLYVAMTRAKDMLIMTECSADIRGRLQKWNAALTEPIRPEIAASALRMGDWILMAALCRTESGELFAVTGPNEVSHLWQDTWKVSYCTVQPDGQNKAETAPKMQNVRRRDAALLAQQTAYQYPYPAAARTASKLTATQLKGRLLDQEAAEHTPQAASSVSAPRRPNFRSSEALSGKERGNATHLFMQFVRYEVCVEEKGIQAELERLVQERFLTPRQAEAVDAMRIRKLFSGSFGARILSAEKVYREFKFSILTDAGEYEAEAAGEQVMLQGVVDCFWEENGELVIADFKTDRIHENLQFRALHYKPQLQAYAKALSRIFQMPVKAKYLYFFDCDTAVEV